MSCVTDRNYLVPRMRAQVRDNHTIVITKFSSPEMIRMILNADERNRKAAAKKAAKIHDAAKDESSERRA